MGVYVSLSPATRQNLSPADIIQRLQSVGFTTVTPSQAEIQDRRVINTETPYGTLCEMWDDQSNIVEVEINHNFPSHFCVWWRYSWGIGSDAYAEELFRLLDLGDRLDWELHGNTGDVVTRETLNDEVYKLTGDSSAAERVIGRASLPVNEPSVPELSPEAKEYLDDLFMKALLRMSPEDAEKFKN